MRAERVPHFSFTIQIPTRDIYWRYLLAILTSNTILSCTNCWPKPLLSQSSIKILLHHSSTLAFFWSDGGPSIKVGEILDDSSTGFYKSSCIHPTCIDIMSLGKLTRSCSLHYKKSFGDCYHCPIDISSAWIDPCPHPM